LPRPHRYDRIIEKVFGDRFRTGDERVDFSRGELESGARALSIPVPKNLGDIL
jgi:hypothetical protein